MHLGKIGPSLGTARIGFGGQEYCARTYSVLCCATGAAKLVAMEVGVAGAIPARALHGGWEADGTPLAAAVGEDPHGGTCPGKTRQGFDGCNVAFGGVERSLKRFKVHAR